MKCFIAWCDIDFHRRNIVNRRRVSKHRFPTDEFRRKEWTDAIKAAVPESFDCDTLNMDTVLLCSEHFTQDCFYDTKSGRKLRKYAVPTILKPPAAKSRSHSTESSRIHFDPVEAELEHPLNISGLPRELRSIDIYSLASASEPSEDLIQLVNSGGETESNPSEEQDVLLESVKSEPEEFDSYMDEFHLHEESKPSPQPTADIEGLIPPEEVPPSSPPPEIPEIKEEPIDFEYIPAAHIQSSAPPDDPLKIQSCLFCFRELSSGLGAALEDGTLRKKIEFVLVARFNFDSNTSCKVPCCASCVQMFDLFYEFKRNCLAALTRQDELRKVSKPPVETVKVPEVKPPQAGKKETPELTEVQQLLPELTVAKVRQKVVEEPKPKVPKSVMIFKCPECPAAFTNEYELSDHAYSHSGISSMKEYFSKTNSATTSKTCNICSLSFGSDKELSDHQMVHAPSVCPRCNGVFALAQDCEIHMTVCQGEENDPQPSSASSSSYEEPTSTDARPCRQCGHLFPVANDILFQHQTKCGALRSRYKCPRCVKSFALKGTLEAHLKLHDGIRPYRCAKPDCDRTFLTQSACSSHEEGCGTLGFVCDICGTSLSTMGSLALHRAKHDEPKLACDQCEKRFHNKHSLQKHMASHSEDRNFECQVCGKRFKSAEANRVHQRTHTQEKPYPCPECGLRFMYNCSLKAHLDKKACIVRGEEGL